MASSLIDELLHIQTWADNWNVLFGAAKDVENGYPSLTFMKTVLAEVNISIRKELSWTHLVDKMTYDAGKRFGVLKRVSPYLNPNQRAMIHKITTE